MRLGRRVWRGRIRRCSNAAGDSAIFSLYRARFFRDANRTAWEAQLLTCLVFGILCFKQRDKSDISCHEPARTHVFDISWHFPPRTRIVLGCRPLSIKVNGICDPCPVQISHNGRYRVRLHARGGDERDVIRSGGLFEGDLVYNVRISGECGSCARGALGDLCM